MIPILFSESSTTFTTNGIGRLSDAIECTVVEERNGQYELELEYPITGSHYSDIKLRAIIVAKPSAGKDIQPFRIYKITKPINGRITVCAQHISYDLSKNTCMPFSVTASSSACASTLSRLKSNAVDTCPFTFSTDVTTVASYNQTIPSSIRQRLGGIEGSVLDQFGGEYEWDNYNVILHKNRGENKDIPLRYGKNIIDIKQEEEISNTITGIVPFWVDSEGNDLVTLPEKAIYSSNVSKYSTRLTVPVDFSGNYQEKPSLTTLRSAANAYINQTGIGVPKVSIDVSFVNLADTEEYKDVVQLQQVNLCDTIPVQFEALGIDTTAQIVKTEYDVLSEKYNSITVGSLRSNLATAISDTNNAITALAENTKTNFSKMSDSLDESINSATAWLTSSGGYVVAVKNSDGTWKELLFMDTNNTSTAKNVLRINENGIGFSSKGIGGPFTQAWTLDGRLVIGGTNVPSITVYDNSNNIIFQASANAMIWNANNSSMDANGNITASNASLTDVTINGGAITNEGYYITTVIESGEIQFYKSDNHAFLGKLHSNSGYDGLEIGSPRLQIGDIDDTDVVSIFAVNSIGIGTKNGALQGYGNINIDSKTITIETDYLYSLRPGGVANTAHRALTTGRVLCEDGQYHNIYNGIICGT